MTLTAICCRKNCDVGFKKILFQLGCPWIGQFEVRHLQGLAHCSALLCCPLCSLGCRAWGRGRLELPWGSLMPICADYPLPLCLRSLTQISDAHSWLWGMFLNQLPPLKLLNDRVFACVGSRGGKSKKFKLLYLWAGCLKPFLGWSILFFFWHMRLYQIYALGLL